MIKSFRLYEELKRKVPDSFTVSDNFFDEFDANKPVIFPKSEKSLLVKDDFTIDGNVATCVEKHCTFEIIRTVPEEYVVIFELIVKEDDNVKSKKFKCDVYHAVEFLNTILNICSKYLDNLKRKLHKDIDPFNEENWDEEEPRYLPKKIEIRRSDMEQIGKEQLREMERMQKRFADASTAARIRKRRDSDRQKDMFSID